MYEGANALWLRWCFPCECCVGVCGAQLWQERKPLGACGVTGAVMSRPGSADAFTREKITRTPFKSLVRYGRTISGNNDLEKRKRLLIDSLHSIRHQPECFGWRGESFKSRYNDRQVVYILRVEQEWKSAICVWPRSHLRVAEMPRGRSRGADWGISYNLGLPPLPIPSSLHVACA